MQLFKKQDAHGKIKKENDDLVFINTKLRKEHRELLGLLNSAKKDYTDDKSKALREFNDYCKDLQNKKDILLKELVLIESENEKRKDIYYGLVTKQDALDERERLIKEENDKLSLRQLYVEELEAKWKEKHG